MVGVFINKNLSNNTNILMIFSRQKRFIWLYQFHMYIRLKKLWSSKRLELWTRCGILNFEPDVVHVFTLHRKLKKKKVKIITDTGHLSMESQDKFHVSFCGCDCSPSHLDFSWWVDGIHCCIMFESESEF